MREDTPPGGSCRCQARTPSVTRSWKLVEPNTVNTLVVTPGNLSVGDFVRIGVLLSLIIMVLSVVMVPRLLPF